MEEVKNWLQSQQMANNLVSEGGSYYKEHYNSNENKLLNITKILWKSPQRALLKLVIQTGLLVLIHNSENKAVCIKMRTLCSRV